jgi:hypothetical protein
MNSHDYVTRAAQPGQGTGFSTISVAESTLLQVAISETLRHTGPKARSKGHREVGHDFLQYMVGKGRDVRKWG